MRIFGLLVTFGIFLILPWFLVGCINYWSYWFRDILSLCCIQQPPQKFKAVPKQRPQTLDSLFSNIQRTRVMSQQNNVQHNDLPRRNGGLQRLPPWQRARFAKSDWLLALIFCKQGKFVLGTKKFELQFDFRNELVCNILTLIVARAKVHCIICSSFGFLLFLSQWPEISHPRCLVIW